MRRPSNRGNYTFGGNLKIAVDHKVSDKTLIRGWLLTLLEIGPAQEREKRRQKNGHPMVPVALHQWRSPVPREMSHQARP
ncbi:hypothetical protein FICEBENF_00801 [Aeromonas hydrophila]